MKLPLALTGRRKHLLLVENWPGAGGTLCIEIAAKAAAYSHGLLVYRP